MTACATPFSRSHAAANPCFIQERSAFSLPEPSRLPPYMDEASRLQAEASQSRRPRPTRTGDNYCMGAPIKVNDGMAEASAYMHALRRDAEGLLARNGTGTAGDNYCMGGSIEVDGMGEVSSNVHAVRRDAEGLLARQGTGGKQYKLEAAVTSPPPPSIAKMRRGSSAFNDPRLQQACP